MVLYKNRHTYIKKYSLLSILYGSLAFDCGFVNVEVAMDEEL